MDGEACRPLPLTAQVSPEEKLPPEHTSALAITRISSQRAGVMYWLSPVCSAEGIVRLLSAIAVKMRTSNHTLSRGAVFFKEAISNILQLLVRNDDVSALMGLL